MPRIWLHCLLAAGLLVAPRAASPSPPRPQAAAALPDPSAAVAVDGDRVFAVGADGRSLLVRSIQQGAEWTTLPVPPFKKVGGLVAAYGQLYITDVGAASIHVMDLQSSAVRLLHAGPPLTRPGELAFAGELVVVDDGRLLLQPPHGGAPRSLRVPPKLLGGRVFVAGPLDEPAEAHLLLANADQGTLFEARLGGDEVLLLRPLISNEATGEPLSRTRTDRESIPQSDFHVIKEPGPLVLRNGIIYVLDLSVNELYAFAREDGRPVRLVHTDAHGVPRARPSRVGVTDQSLIVLDALGRDVVVCPRLVPAELRLRASVSEPLAALYTHLHERSSLPTRTVSFRRTLETTLRENHVLLAPYLQTLDRLMCDLNPTLCQDGHLRPMSNGEPLVVPDIRSERFIDVEKTQLAGHSTLGEHVDRLVRSDEFAFWRTDEALRRLNGLGPEQLKNAAVWPERDAADQPRQQRTGEFSVPVEHARYVAAVPADDLSLDSAPLAQWLNSFEGVLFYSLEERRASALGQPPGAETPEAKALRDAFEKATALARYGRPHPTPILVRAFVGVAEESIDRDHPVFGVAGDNAFDLDSQQRAQPASSLAPPDPTSLVTRKPTKVDHGTMVASIIAGRHTPFETTGLAPTAMLFALPSAEPAIGDAIRKAYLDHQVRIFNISAHYGRDQPRPQTLELSIRNYTHALFVVAAGNDWDDTNGGQLCVDFVVYPGCWADRKNVLVVTATDASGDALLGPSTSATGQTVPGANWHATKVHVAAPGEGYHAAAAGGAYAPARGSSFAAPMVTATAALLYAQGVTDPWLIKQRIIATGDLLPGLKGKALGGRLNVERAVSLPNVGILRASNTRRLLRPLPGSTISVREGWGDPVRPVKVENIRRLTRLPGGKYRIVFLEEDGDLKIMEDAEFPDSDNSRFRYALVEELKSTLPGGQSQVYLIQRGGVGETDTFVNWDDYIGPVL